MNRSESVLLAKKFIKANIYGEIRLENPNMTFVNTEAILDGGIINGVNSYDVNKVVNLNRAWKFVLRTKEFINYQQVLEIHKLVAFEDALDEGKLRTGNTSVTNTNYVPVIPKEIEVKSKISEIFNISDPYEAASKYLAYAIKSQLFWNGNKRTSLLVASKLLIDRGAGIILFESDSLVSFSKHLKKYYDDETYLDEFIKFIKSDLIINTYDKKLDLTISYNEVVSEEVKSYITVKVTNNCNKQIRLNSIEHDLLISEVVEQTLSKINGIKLKKHENKTKVMRLEIKESKIKELKKISFQNDISVGDVIVSLFDN